MSLELRLRVSNILMSQPGLQVDFECETITVNPDGIGRVYFALLRGAIDVVVEPVPRGAEAAYSRPRNVFIVPDPTYGLDAEEMSTLFHEAIHAMGDIDRGWWRAYTESEAAAYIAECLFYRYLTGRTIPADFPNTPPEFVAADRIADTIKGSKGAVVNINDVINLRKIIVSRPGYRERHITFGQLTSDDGVYQ